MENPDFNFSSDPAHRYATEDANGNALQVGIVLAEGLLRITQPNGAVHEFPLTVDGEPCPQAVMLSEDPATGRLLELGNADFLGQPEFLENHALNDDDVLDSWNLNVVDGGIGLLDIRNVGRMIQTRYDISRVPVVLSIAGAFLRVATLKHFASSGLAPWYEQVSLPQP